MFEELKDKIKDKKLILFGEIHGTKENYRMLLRFFSEIAKEQDFNLCLEIPIEFQSQIDSFMKNGNYNILKKIPFFSKENLDSRNNQEYINFIKEIYKINLKNQKNIKIFFIEPFAYNQEEKEMGLAKNILKLINNEKIFVILGDIHASKKQINLFGPKIIPTGLLVLNKVGKKMFNVRLTQKKRILSKEERLFNQGFDYILTL